jgi:HD superfamily phosphodiesterase
MAEWHIMNWEQFTQELFRLAEPYLETRDDLLHTRVAYQYAVYLLEKETGDKKIVEPAVILHDVGWSQLKPEEIKIAFGANAKGEKAKKLNRIHEVEGKRLKRSWSRMQTGSGDFPKSVTIMRCSGRIQPMKSGTIF